MTCHLMNALTPDFLDELQQRHAHSERLLVSHILNSRFPHIPPFDFESMTKMACSIQGSIIEGSLETKVPTIWTDEKHSQEEAEPGRNLDVEKVRREKIRDGESQKSEDAGARKGRKVAKHSVFPMFCGSGGSKRRLGGCGASSARHMTDEKLHAVVARSNL